MVTFGTMIMPCLWLFVSPLGAKLVQCLQRLNLVLNDMFLRCKWIVGFEVGVVAYSAQLAKRADFYKTSTREGAKVVILFFNLKLKSRQKTSY